MASAYNGHGTVMCRCLVFRAELCACQDFSVYEESSVLSCIIDPFDQGNMSSHYFYAGNTVGVDTASCIHIRKIGCVQPWAVGMSRDQRKSCFCGKGGKTLFYLILMPVIFCRTGGVKHAVVFQGTPDIAD